MKKIQILTVLGFLFIGITKLSAQSNIRGMIMDIKNNPIKNATVLLLKFSDSSLVKGLLSDENGKYIFLNVKYGTYLLSASFSGMRQSFSPAFEVVPSKKEIEAEVLHLENIEVRLNDVSLVAKKPMFEQKIDRMVINVANSITSAGSSVLEVLQRSPGIIVDRQNNSISMNGKNGIVVMINGRISHMPMEALVQYLSGMNSDNVERIELITTPPANLDAEGNAGYINIVLKTNTSYGTNGSYSLSAGYTKGGASTGASIDLNHRKGKINLYGDYTFSNNYPYQLMSFYHKIANNDTVTENKTENHRHSESLNQNARIGLDYQLSTKTIVGILASGYDNQFTDKANNNGSIVINNQLDSLLSVSNHETNTWSNISGNFNIQHSFSDSEKITFNADYIYYKDDNPNTYSDHYDNAYGKFLRSQNIRSSKITPLHFWVGALDFEKKLTGKSNLEAGIKASLSHFNNDVAVQDQNQNKWITDSSYSANSALKENVLAGYLSFNSQVTPKTGIKIGLRYENTYTNLGSPTEKDIVDRHYGQLFPSFFLSHKINENNAWNLSYSRRITRPAFNDLAPFVIFQDPSTFFSGNPNLKPAITNSANVAYTFKRIFLSVSYSYETNTITDYTPTEDPVTNIETLAAANQKNNIIWAATLSVPVNVNKWWSMQFNIVGNNDALSGNVSGSAITIKQKYLQFNTQQSFTFPKDFSLELSGFYTTKTLTFGLYPTPGYGELDFGIQKKFAKSHSNLRLNASNILNSMVLKPSLNYPQQNLVGGATLIFYYPSLSLTYTHNFGNLKVKSYRNRTTGAEEEKGRVQ